MWRPQAPRGLCTGRRRAVWPLSGLRFWLENDLRPEAGRGQGQAREGLDHRFWGAQKEPEAAPLRAGTGAGAASWPGTGWLQSLQQRSPRQAGEGGLQALSTSCARTPAAVAVLTAQGHQPRQPGPCGPEPLGLGHTSQGGSQLLNHATLGPAPSAAPGALADPREARGFGDRKAPV